MRQRLELKQRTSVNVSVRRRLITVGAVVSTVAILGALLFLYGNFGASENAKAAVSTNMGFENSLTDWSTVSGTWTANSTATYVRSGSRSTKITVANGGTGELKNILSTAVAPLTGTNYVVVTAWAKSSTSYGRLKVGYINTLTSVKTLATSYTTLNSSGFTRVQAVLSVANGATVAPFVNASASGGSSDVYVDDVQMYVGTANNADNTAPGGPAAASAACVGSAVTLSWTNGTDAESGVGGVLVLRQAGLQSGAQTLNDQTAYDPTSSTVGPTTAGAWTVVYNGPTVGTIADNPGSTGTYTYLIYMKDQAGNYTAAASAARLGVVNGSSLSVSLSSSTALDGLYLPSGCTLTVPVSQTLTFNAGSTINVYGTLVHQGAVVNNGTINMKNNSVYNYNRNGSSSSYAIPTANWETGSTCLVTGVDNQAPLGLNQSFYNFTWNCTSQNANVNIPDGLVVNGAATITESATGNSKKYLEFAGITHFKGNFYSGTNAEVRFNATSSYVYFDGSSQQSIQLVNNNNNAFTNIVINNAAGVKIMQDLVVYASCALQSGSLDLNGYKLYTYSACGLVSSGGNATNGTVMPWTGNGGGTYDLTYTSACTTGVELSSSTTALDDLTINVPSGTVTLDKSIRINGKLHLTSGKLKTTGSDIVYVANSSTDAVDFADLSGYVIGSLRRNVTGNGTYNFPVGSTGYAQNVDVKLNNLVGVGYVTVTFNPTIVGALPSSATCIANGVGINTLYNAGYWTIHPDNQPTAGTYEVRIRSKGGSNAPASVSNAAVIKRSSSSAAWAALGTQDNANNSMSNGRLDIRVKNLTSFSDFGIGYGNTTLPITLSAFDANAADGKVELTWTTSAELNNAYFTLERSANGIDFESIVEQQGAGTSVVRHDYGYTDESPLAGTSYYRIKQVDFDGKFTYSPIRAVSGVGATGSSEVLTPAPDVVVYPNPGEGLFTFDGVVTNGSRQGASVRIFDVKGQLISIHNFSDGELIRVDLTSQPPGLYTATVVDANDQSVTKRLVIQR